MELIKKIKSWLKEFKKTQPDNLSIDEDTFEGSAYYLLIEALEYVKLMENSGYGGKWRE